MKTTTKIKTMGAMLSAAVLALVSTPASAFGPWPRTTYTMDSPATEAVFNSITDNPAVGSEVGFVRVVEKGATDPTTGEPAAYALEWEIEPDKEYEIYIYYHNNADTQLNAAGNTILNPKSVASNVKLATAFPNSLEKGESGDVVGQISWVVGTKSSDEVTDADIQKVWAEATLTAKEAVTIKYVTGSAKIYNQFSELSGSVLPTTLFSSTGTYLGMTSLDGVVNGCAAYSGHVLYTLRTFAVEDLEKLPETGAKEIVAAVILTTLIAGGAVVYVCTHRAVSRATKRAKGKK